MVLVPYAEKPSVIEHAGGLFVSERPSRGIGYQANPTGHNLLSLQDYSAICNLRDSVYT